ncbi:hypothetical protein HHK36_025112 [Tetracentron sinense]|uniref:Glycosyltransferase family 92 protein n=1 Tax=Tetracentron sinense TaxID=13715 RepID=A0A834YP99_TETSI|nr:hypothetical protein HHK36_025112 [Tetracentron sinense]
MTMKERRKRDVGSWSRFFYCTVFVVFFCVLFTGFTFSSFRLFGESFHPVLVSAWQNPAMEAISGEFPVSPSIEIRETVIFPDHILIFLQYPPSLPLFTKEDIDCSYFPPNSSQSQSHLKLPPLYIAGENLDHQIVRCPIPPRGFTPSLALKTNGHLPAGPTHRWDALAYEALVDRDNTTILFVKGLNLRPERISDASRFECVYGWDFKRPKFLLRADVVTVAQEIARCKTPLSVLNSPQKLNAIKVSIRVKGRGILHSVARPQFRPESDTPVPKRYEMCVCTMVRNQAKFLREWVMYHARIGVQRWFIYDNDSDDAIDPVIESLDEENFNITRHIWPWIKTQEAGFAHCALRARGSCEWVGFIDVDEFLHLPGNLSLHDVLRNQSGSHRVGELRTSCHSFGPSGLKRVPSEGVTVGYTCRVSVPERHKSIVRPEALNSSLINVVHHFHLRDNFEYVNVERGVMVINHYKYQVWEVFKDKFYRRVATYVADWQDKENVGSKDRAPGLGTEAVEPSDWSSRFCEVTDTGLKDWVLRVFADPQTHLLPWQEQQEEQEDRLFIEGNYEIEKEMKQRDSVVVKDVN